MDLCEKHENAKQYALGLNARAQRDNLWAYESALLSQIDAIDIYLYNVDTKKIKDDYITLPVFCIQAAEYAIKAKRYDDAIKYAELGLRRDHIAMSLQNKLDALRLEALCEKSLCNG